LRRLRGLLLVVSLLAVTAPTLAQSPAPLKVIVGDGELLFDGQNLDADQLRTRLAATGRQAEKILLQIGPTAKTVYIHRALDAIHAAGFGNIALVGPTGVEIPGEPPI
jgi:biopolymer transport protein ExbD